MKKLISKPMLLLAVAAVLLIASSIGSTQAALTYYSENYEAEVNVSNIGVTVLENNNAVQGTLTLADDEKLIPGKVYTDTVTVANTGSIDAYVRVIVRKSWKDAKGEKDTTLSPAYIELNVLENNGWIKDTNSSTGEKEVYYYSKALGQGAATTSLIDTFKINPQVAKELYRTTNDNIITYEYKYEGYQCTVEIEAQAVQTHNGEEAIKGEWGANVTISEDGTLSLN